MAKRAKPGQFSAYLRKLTEETKWNDSDVAKLFGYQGGSSVAQIRGGYHLPPLVTLTVFLSRLPREYREEALAAYLQDYLPKGLHNRFEIAIRLRQGSDASEDIWESPWVTKGEHEEDLPCAIESKPRSKSTKIDLQPGLNSWQRLIMGNWQSD